MPDEPPVDPSERFLKRKDEWRKRLATTKPTETSWEEIPCAGLDSVAFSPSSFDLKK